MHERSKYEQPEQLICHYIQVSSYEKILKHAFEHLAKTYHTEFHYSLFSHPSQLHFEREVPTRPAVQPWKKNEKESHKNGKRILCFLSKSDKRKNKKKFSVQLAPDMGTSDVIFKK